MSKKRSTARITLHRSDYVRRQFEIKKYEKMDTLLKNKHIAAFLAPSDVECEINGHQLECGV